MTRSQMAMFIREVADGALCDDEWAEVMPTHYQDILTENARRKAVEVCLGYSDMPTEEKRQFLLEVANGLEEPTRDHEFYYRSEAVGILKELPRAGENRELGYEPYRSAGHYELATVLSDGRTAICEYMQGGQRRAFTVLSCPSYGQLTTTGEPTSA